MNTTRFSTITRLSVATFALGALAFAVPAGAAAAGPVNCVDVTGRAAANVACYEEVWSNGVQLRMTFANQHFTGATPQPLDPFYVVAPQSGTPQGAPPNTFPHDHVAPNVPAGNHGDYSVRLQGFFVLCSGQGIVSGACVPAWTSVGGPDPLPFAATVNGRRLTSTGAIESAAAAGLVAPVNLGPDAVILGTISGH